MNYPLWLFGISALVALFEYMWPAREQPFIRSSLWSDIVYLIFNGHFLGMFLYGIASYHVLPHFDLYLQENGIHHLVYYQAVQNWGWSIVTQSIAVLVIKDFIEWIIHNALHRLPFFWNFHKIHHSVKDGEMSWIVAFRFSWLEVVTYKSLTYLPLIWFGFATEALIVPIILSTLIGHLNHSNLAWDYGWGKYIINSPRMHLYHHDYHAPPTGQNFGIVFSCWDWIFGTARLPKTPPQRIGYPQEHELPNDFLGQLIWPLPMVIQKLKNLPHTNRFLGLALLFILYMFSLP